MDRSDFAELRKRLAEGHAVGTVEGEITRGKFLFNWVVENKLLTTLPDYGKQFRVPSAKEKRRARNERGPRMFQRHELWQLLNGDDMSAVYIQEISDDRLERVAEFVRSWLWARPTTEGGAA